MRLITPLICLTLAVVNFLSAEGTREVAPNGSIVIGATTTTDLAALHINHPSYNSFASYTNNDPHSRLYIHINDPAKECVYLGFSFGHVNVSSPNPGRINFEYRIKDPAGNVVFGPVTVLTNAANIQNWSEAFTGPMQIHGAGGYDAHLATSADLGSQGWTGAGDYYLEFLSEPGNDLLIDFWDITVADCTPEFPEERKGRVWSYNWSIFAVNDFGFPSRPFNGAFYVCAPDPDDADKAFITRIDFNGSGFRPAAFNIAFNSFGSQNTGVIEVDRKSVDDANLTQSEYAIFLNDPVELCETAVAGEITLHGISRCDAGDYCIKFTASKEGQIDLLLDFDGPDDIYMPGTRDILVTHEVTSDQVGKPTCIAWNGLDGLGGALPEEAGIQIPITISYAQGIYHFPIYDAEFMTTGFNLAAIRPAASIPLLYYDDSAISVVSGSGEPVTQLAGCIVPCHRWINFPNANIPGYGNLNTINSWWFSQRILRQDVLFLPAYYTCEADGPESICQGGSTQIISHPQVHPATLDVPEIISTIWTGPGIVGPTTGPSITINAEGSYTVEVTWLTALGDTCSATCDYELHFDPPLTETIDTLIVHGQVLEINGEEYTEAGQYIQELTNSFGCDSILTINVKVLQTVLHYNLDACESFMLLGSHMDYSEFTVQYPQPLSCADISATIVFREPAQMQKHSCTPGINDSPAMCISSLDTCDYDPGNDASLIFEVTITPGDTAVHVTGFSFFEKAPLMYNWIEGPSGLNNYPTFYGLRILKNGVEIYQRKDIPTSLVWTEQVYNFLNEEEFIIEDPATFRFELLPYCLVGNGAEVAAWDIDEIRVTASCAPFEGLFQTISGVVKTPLGTLVKDAKINLLASRPEPNQRITLTGEQGEYIFENVPEGSECKITASKDGIYVQGVSTLDLVHIQKHLLGIKVFDSPYKFVAADANRSNSISAKDLLELRKLILGIYQELPHNTSWRLGTADENFSGSFTWGFKETIDIELLQYDFGNADFTAVKIGDVNGDAEVNANGLPITSRTKDVFNLRLSGDKFPGSHLGTIDFFTTDQFDLAGIQFALDLGDLELPGLIAGVLPVADENFQINNNELRFSWNADQVLHLNAGDKLFSLQFNLAPNSDISNNLAIRHHPMRAEAYIGDELDVMDVELEFLQQTYPGSSRHLFQNEPNPFSANTTIRFQIEKAGMATIGIMDISGRVLKDISGHYEAGLHAFDISRSEIGITEGVLLCQLTYDNYTETIKMFLMH